jgi:site-specific DNA recombinase
MKKNFKPASVPQFNRCAYYGRCATQMQALASIEDQERIRRDFATQQGWQILEEHIYLDAGLSGISKVKRKGLETLKTDAQKHPRPFDYILFGDVSRLSRNFSDVLAFAKLMRHYGIKVCFVSEKLDSSDPNFDLVLTMDGIVDEQYITRLGTKIKSAQKGQMIEAFTAGKRPLGYPAVAPRATGRAATKGTKLKVIEGEAEMIRRIFQLYADRYSMDEISLKLKVEKHSPQNYRSVQKAR